jgi:hypothetical protein
MSQPSQSKHVGRKIWYGAVIALSALLLLACALGVVGTWVLESKLSDATVALLQTAENVIGKAQDVIGQVQEPLGEIQQIATGVAEASSQLSQNVKDEGLLKLLLPAEQEQKLVNLGTKIQDTLATIHDVLAAAVDMYQAIDRVPFIDLPKPGLEQVEAVQQSVNDIRLSIEELKGKVAEVRAGAADKIGVVTEIATRVADRSSQASSNLSTLDTELEGFQQKLAGIRSAVPTVFAILALLFTLLLLYVGYTQVEVVRLFVGRWRALPSEVAEAPVLPETAAPVEEAPALVAEEPPPTVESEEGKAQE